jgi:hypothetical protein
MIEWLNTPITRADIICWLLGIPLGVLWLWWVNKCWENY